ncbi:mitochondrial threonyl tRNA synthetase [Spathaspora passalidarum NRRL Y-27907]|uniref:threonine--tRNA ligase n=1 Tax=Spathaspora passalidarum (strain NRRL Y-27907 / 11-Y1) TaxID=619300 RepID=G3AEZ5_SPAPN|nr:mitochondrial threonyl tRNA synthetase [Spathaspora passalidarum NRRL Y-27907]EGW34799.1 mitochondrial threonyl tRNA synthetase [Spathaspora passalidarum NRRL Y-27907]
MYVTRAIASELRIARTIPIRTYSSKPKDNNKPKEAISSTQSNHALSQQQLLYTTDPTSPGSIFFLPHGTRIFNKLIQFMKNQQTKYGFQEVVTPLIYKTKLWKQSGHWDNYKEDMFKVLGNDQSRDDELAVEPCGSHHVHEEEFHEYGLKPMNCPGHCMIFAKFERSYNELPIRYSDFSSLHRNEASGALSGLTRVRRFHQDDGHIFCELSQIDQEIKNTINLIKDTYGVFGIGVNDIEFYLSTRPEDKFMGDIETWNVAEQQLKNVLNSTTDKWEIREGDGAFYGPKIDVLLTDAFKKKHQVGTIQLDFQLPSRFELKYISQDGTRTNRPILVHRAVFGSLERFFAILLDHYQGNWPFWINPRQAVIIPVSSSHHEYAEALQKQLSGDILNSEDIAPITGYHFYVDVDKRDATVGLRIKEAIQKGYSYIIMVGDKDIANGTYAIRTRTDRKITSMTGDAIYQMFISLERQFK